VRKLQIRVTTITLAVPYALRVKRLEISTRIGGQKRAILKGARSNSTLRQLGPFGTSKGRGGDWYRGILNAAGDWKGFHTRLGG